jgi:hypothetical protein
MLLSAGGFAVFRAETHAYDVLGPRYGHLRTPVLRQRFIQEWVKTRHFELSQLDALEFSQRMTADCSSIGDFLRIFLGGIATRQQVSRWSDCTPAHISHMAAIKREIPSALFIHVIRDGRDVALSAARLGWLRPLPADRTSPRLLAALGWRWAVRAGRSAGRALGDCYCEIRFEELVQQPQAVLDRLSPFIDHSLDYDRISKVGIGSVTKPNTSFQSPDKSFEPVGRFKTGLQNGELAEVEFLVGDLLDDLGYARSSARLGSAAALLAVKRMVYDRYFSGKQWARVHTPLGRRTSLASLNIW